MNVPNRFRWRFRTVVPCAAAVFALLATAVPLAVAVADSKASRYYEDALQRYEKKDYRGAIVQLKNALQADNGMLAGQVLLGRALLASGEFSAAEVAFEEALKLGVSRAEVVVPLAEAVIAQGRPDQLLLQPRFAHTALPIEPRVRLLLLKAAAASDTGRLREADALLAEARALDNTSAASWVAEVPIRVRAGQSAQARQAAEKAVALDPKSAEAAYQQGTVSHVSGQLAAAVSQYTRALQLQPGHVDALVARAGLYVDLGQIDAASADMRAARKEAPADPRAVYLAALLAERAGETAEAKRLMAEVGNLLDQVPLDALRYRPQALMLGGLAHFALKNYEKALPYLQTAVRQDSASPAAKLLGQILLIQGQADGAVDALQGYLRARPNDRQAMVLLSTAQMRQGRYARAAQTMDELLRSADDPAIRAQLGVSLLGAGQFAAGAAELEAALKKDPSNVRAGAALAGLYLASRQPDKAAAVASALVRRVPTNAGLQNLLGSAQAARGDSASARLAFEQALKLDPSFAEPQLNLARLDIAARSYEAAQGRLNAILSRDDKDVAALIEMARLSAARGQFDDAQRWLTKAEEVGADKLQPALEMVDFQLARERPDLAMESVKRLRAKAPETLLVILAEARVQIASGDLAGARRTLARATAVASFDAAPLVRIAEMQLQADNVSGAAHALDKALAANPSHLRAKALRANTYMLEGDMARAERLAREIVAAEPGLALGYGLLGDLAMARSQPAAAVDAYRRALQIQPDSESFLRLYAALDRTQHAAAVKAAEDWLRKHPKDVRVWRLLADSNARSGNFTAARAAYEALLKENPNDAEALNNLAIVLISLGDASALSVADRAMALKPQTAHIVGTAGWAAFHAGQTDRALQLLRDARLRDPSNPGTRYFLAVVLARQGRSSEARQELQAALGAGPGFAYSTQAQALLKTLE